MGLHRWSPWVVSTGLCGSPHVVSVGLHGWSPWLVSAGLHGSPWVSMSGLCGSLRVVVGKINQSKSVPMMICGDCGEEY